MSTSFSVSFGKNISWIYSLNLFAKLLLLNDFLENVNVNYFFRKQKLISFISKKTFKDCLSFSWPKSIVNSFNKYPLLWLPTFAYSTKLAIFIV
jgi:hypothetical protein